MFHRKRFAPRDQLLFFDRLKIDKLSFRNPWTVAMNEKEKDEWMKAKPYSEIPGPKPLPIPKYGNVWRVIANGNIELSNYIILVMIATK